MKTLLAFSSFVLLAVCAHATPASLTDQLLKSTAATSADVRAGTIKLINVACMNGTCDGINASSDDEFVVRGSAAASLIHAMKQNGNKVYGREISSSEVDCGNSGCSIDDEGYLDVDANGYSKYFNVVQWARQRNK